MRKINNIIIHHSLSFWGDGETIRHWHCDPRPQGNGWKNPGYHLVIGNCYPTYSAWHNRKPGVHADGYGYHLLPLERVSNGCKYANSDSINICLIGNFDVDMPSEKQMQILVKVCKFFCESLNLDPLKAIRGHGEMQKQIGRESYIKSCPGRNFDMKALRLTVQDALKKKNN